MCCLCDSQRELGLPVTRLTVVFLQMFFYWHTVVLVTASVGRFMKLAYNQKWTQVEDMFEVFFFFFFLGGGVWELPVISLTGKALLYHYLLLKKRTPFHILNNIATLF